MKTATMRRCRAFALCAGILFCSALAGADFDYKFDAEKNTLNDFVPAEAYFKYIGKKIFIENKNNKVHLRTDASNCSFVHRKNFSKGSVSLKFQIIWKTDVSLFAHCDKSAYNGYRLQYWYAEKKLVLSRMLGGKRTELKSIPVIPSRDVEIGLIFDGKNITGLYNGDAAFSIPDDGKCGSGYFGFGGQYYTNIQLISIKQTDSIPVVKTSSVEVKKKQ